MDNIQFTGPLMGLLSFLVIGIFHPVVVKLEYAYGKKSWGLLFVPGVFFIILSLFVSTIWSIISGVVGFSMIWSTIEIFKQHNRVLNKQAKPNPDRKYN